MTEVSKSAILTRAQEVIDEVIANANDEARIGGIFRDIADSFKHNDDNYNVVYVDDYGAVGDGVTDDSAALQLAFTAASAIDGVVEFTTGKTYLVSNSIIIYERLIINGNRATIKRDDEIVTTTTAVASDGATTLEVTDASIFSVGETVSILDITGTYSGQASEDISYPFRNITDITDNTITLDGGISLPDSGNLNVAGEYAIGSKVIKLYELLNPNQSSSIAVDGLIFNELHFDGNRDNNTTYAGWRGNSTISIGIPPGTIFNKCVFYDIPNENIYPYIDTIIANCHFYDCNGSGSHSSAASRALYIGNTYKNISEVGEEVNGHGEAAITFSTTVQEQIIIGNNFKDLGGAVFGTWSDDDNRVVFSNNIVDGARCLCYGYTGVDGPLIGLTITGNHIKDADNFYLDNRTGGSGGYVRYGRGYVDINISDNVFINTRLKIQNTSNFVISNNTFKADEGYTWENYLFTDNAFLNLYDCVSGAISGNVFSNRQTTETSSLYGAINLGGAGSAIPLIKSDASTDTAYIYQRNITVSNNRAEGLRFIIKGQTSNPALGLSVAWSSYGNKFTDNVFIGRAGLTNEAYASILHPGWVVRGNDFYGDSGYLLGMQIVCVRTNTLPGAMVIDNTFVGFTNSIAVGVAADITSGYGYGSIVKRNFIDSAITDNSGGNSTIADNETIVAGSPLLQQPGENPEYY